MRGNWLTSSLSAVVQGTLEKELAPPSGTSTYDPAVIFDNLRISPGRWLHIIKFTVTSPDDADIELTSLAGKAGGSPVSMTDDYRK